MLRMHNRSHFIDFTRIHLCNIHICGEPPYPTNYPRRARSRETSPLPQQPLIIPNLWLTSSALLVRLLTIRCSSHLGFKSVLREKASDHLGLTTPYSRPGRRPLLVSEVQWGPQLQLLLILPLVPKLEHRWPDILIALDEYLGGAEAFPTGLYHPAYIVSYTVVVHLSFVLFPSSRGPSSATIVSSFALPLLCQDAHSDSP